MSGVNLKVDVAAAAVENDHAKAGENTGALENRVSPITSCKLDGTDAAFNAAMESLKSNWGVEEFPEEPKVEEGAAAVPLPKKNSKKKVFTKKLTPQSGVKQRKQTVAQKKEVFRQKLHSYMESRLQEAVKSYDPGIKHFLCKNLIIKADFITCLDDLYVKHIGNFNSRVRRELDNEDLQSSLVDQFYRDLREKFIDARDVYANNQEEAAEVCQYVDSELEGAPDDVVKKFKSHELFDLRTNYILGRISYNTLLQKVEIKAFEKMVELNVLKEVEGAVLTFDPAESRVEEYLESAEKAFFSRVSDVYEDRYCELSADVQSDAFKRQVSDDSILRYKLALTKSIFEKGIKFKERKLAFLEDNPSVLTELSRVDLGLDTKERLQLQESVFKPLLRDHFQGRVTIEELISRYSAASVKQMKVGASLRHRNFFVKQLKEIVHAATVPLVKGCILTKQLNIPECIANGSTFIFSRTPDSLKEKWAEIGIDWKKIAHEEFKRYLTCEIREKRFSVLEENGEFKLATAKSLLGHSKLHMHYLKDGVLVKLSDEFVGGKKSFTEILKEIEEQGELFRSELMRAFRKTIEMKIEGYVQLTAETYSPPRSNSEAFINSKDILARKYFSQNVRLQRLKLAPEVRKNLHVESYRQACTAVFKEDLSAALKVRREKFIGSSEMEANLRGEIERLPILMQIKLTQKFYILANKEYIPGNASYLVFMKKFRNVVQNIRRLAEAMK